MVWSAWLRVFTNKCNYDKFNNLTLSKSFGLGFLVYVEHESTLSNSKWFDSDEKIKL